MPHSTVITRIEINRKSRKHYFIYADDTLLFEIGEDTLVHFALSKGAVLSSEKIEAIIFFNRMNGCLSQAYRFLQRRPHLKKELLRKLREKGYEHDILDAAINRLEEKKYVNDREYIEMFIRDAIKQQKSGPQLLLKKLTEKGAYKEQALQILGELYPEENQIEVLKTVLEKKARNVQETDKNKYRQKIIRFALGRGFSWHLIEKMKF